MSSTKGYLMHITEQFADDNSLSYRPMMGEYLLYYKGKLVGGIYDDRLLIKPTPSALRRLPSFPMETPYDGAKPMILFTETENGELLRALFEDVFSDLPPAKR